MRSFRLIFVISLFSISLPGQRFFQMLRVDAAAYTNKQMLFGSYEFGWRRICFTAGYGFMQGTDEHFLLDADLNDVKKKEDINGSQSVFPEIEPSHAHLEHTFSTYTGTQVRGGFTVFFRNNDTLARRPMTGPHIGVNFVYMLAKEMQDITYKADTTETRYYFSGVNKYNILGASTNIGWQFAFFKARLYFDLRACITFYYPLMNEPNLRSPFAGNRIEGQIGIGWHFVGIHSKDKEKENDPDNEHQGGGVIRQGI